MFAPVHESGYGTSRTSGNVRYCAAVGGQVDIARAKSRRFDLSVRALGNRLPMKWAQRIGSFVKTEGGFQSGVGDCKKAINLVRSSADASPPYGFMLLPGTTSSGLAMKLSSFSLSHTKSAPFIALE